MPRAARRSEPRSAIPPPTHALSAPRSAKPRCAPRPRRGRTTGRMCIRKPTSARYGLSLCPPQRLNSATPTLAHHARAIAHGTPPIPGTRPDSRGRRHRRIVGTEISPLSDPAPPRFPPSCAESLRTTRSHSRPRHTPRSHSTCLGLRWTRHRALARGWRTPITPMWTLLAPPRPVRIRDTPARSTAWAARSRREVTKRNRLPKGSTHEPGRTHGREGRTSTPHGRSANLDLWKIRPDPPLASGSSPACDCFARRTRSTAACRAPPDPPITYGIGHYD